MHLCRTQIHINAIWRWTLQQRLGWYLRWLPSWTLTMQPSFFSRIPLRQWPLLSTAAGIGFCWGSANVETEVSHQFLCWRLYCKSSWKTLHWPRFNWKSIWPDFKKLSYFISAIAADESWSCSSFSVSSIYVISIISISSVSSKTMRL